jgi:hypothetical protein
MQIASVLTTADVLLITYGLSQKLAGALFLASSIPIVVLIVYVIIYSGTAPIISLAIRLERKLLIHGDSLAVTYAKIHLKPLMPGSMSVEDLDDEALIKLDKNRLWRHWLWRQVPIILYTATVVQIGLGILSLTVYHYRFM